MQTSQQLYIRDRMKMTAFYPQLSGSPGCSKWNLSPPQTPITSVSVFCCILNSRMLYAQTNYHIAFFLSQTWSLCQHQVHFFSSRNNFLTGSRIRTWKLPGRPDFYQCVLWKLCSCFLFPTRFTSPQEGSVLYALLPLHGTFSKAMLQKISNLACQRV